MLHSSDKLATRLCQILMRFNNGESFSADELALEFGVDKRTILRDFERLNFMPIKKEKGRYSLESYALGHLSFKDIRNFAILSGMSELYPSLDKEFISDLLNSKIKRAYLIRQSYQKPSDRKLFEALSVAILKHNEVEFFYKDKMRLVKPYKLTNNGGIWYLLADENDRLKNFTFEKITEFKHHENRHFEPKDEFSTLIKEGKSRWFGEEKTAILKVKNEAKDYLLRKDNLNEFEILEQDESHFLLQVKFSYDDEILHLIKQWIPYISIAEPLELKDKLNVILKQYLSENS